jgi:TonB family protein
MAKGKQTCKILKEIRKQVAEENDIELVVSECTYQGDCKGTCPKCEAEVRYLERELEKRQRMGKAAVFAGISLGTLFAATGCNQSTQPVSNNHSCSSQTEIHDQKLAGDVVADEPVPKDTIIEEPLMGIVAVFRMTYDFKVEDYQNLMKEKFVFPEMMNLSIVGGSIEYEKVDRGDVCDTFEKLVEATEKFEAPCYPRGERGVLETLAGQLMVDASKYQGDMEVAFLVDRMGNVLDIEVQKGVDKALDDAVVSVMKTLKWHPAYYQLKDDDIRWPFDCRCVLTIRFPIEIKVYGQIQETAPMFRGGNRKLQEFINDNLAYPQEAADAGVEGKVLVEFYIEKDGTISNAKVLQGIGYGCDDEALRVVGLMPKWVPGKQKGECIRVRYTLPINFKLD